METRGFLANMRLRNKKTPKLQLGRKNAKKRKEKNLFNVQRYDDFAQNEEK